MFEFALDPVNLAIGGVALPALIYLTVAALKAVGLVNPKDTEEKKKANLLVGLGWAVVGISYTLLPVIRPVAEVIVTWLYGSLVAGLFYNVKENIKNYVEGG